MLPELHEAIARKAAPSQPGSSQGTAGRRLRHGQQCPRGPPSAQCFAFCHLFVQLGYQHRLRARTVRVRSVHDENMRFGWQPMGAYYPCRRWPLQAGPAGRASVRTSHQPTPSARRTSTDRTRE
eukprot:366229-Chlamydomonas_euryale.AAC.55